MAISQQMLKISILDISLKMTSLKSQLYLPEAIELMSTISLIQVSWLAGAVAILI